MALDTSYLKTRGIIPDYDAIRNRVWSEAKPCAICQKPVHPANLVKHNALYHAVKVDAIAADHHPAKVPKFVITPVKILCLPAKCEGGEVADRVNPTRTPLTDRDLTRAGFILPRIVNASTTEPLITSPVSPASSKLLQSDISAKASLVDEELVAYFKAVKSHDLEGQRIALESLREDAPALLKLCGEDTGKAADCVVKDMKERGAFDNECIQPGLGLEVPG